MIRTSAVAPGEMALVLEPEPGDGDLQCASAITKWPPERTAVLFVTFVDTPQQRLTVWTDRTATSPTAMAIVTAREGGNHPENELVNDAFVSTMAHPSNLTRLGVEITRALEYLQGESDAQIVVCLHGISVLFHHVNHDDAFRFMQILRDRFIAESAAVHAHLDATAHEERTVAKLRWMFDTVIE